MTTNDLVGLLNELAVTLWDEDDHDGNTGKWLREAAARIVELGASNLAYAQRRTSDAFRIAALEARLALAEEVVRAISGHHYHTANGEHPNSPAHSIWGRENPNCDVCSAVFAYDASTDKPSGEVKE